jgi:hypothetical protein
VFVRVCVALCAGNLRGDVLAALQTMLRGAIGDSRRELAIGAPARAGCVDPCGASVTLPDDTRARGVSEITSRGPVTKGDHISAVGGELRIASTPRVGRIVRRSARREAAP